MIDVCPSGKDIEWEKAIWRAIKIQIYTYFEYQTERIYLFRAWPNWNLDVISLTKRNQSRNGCALLALSLWS